MFGLFVGLILAAEIIALGVLRNVAPGVQVVWLFPIIPLTLAVALLARRWTGGAAYRMRWISPEEIVDHGLPQSPTADSPEKLSRSIVERATEIRRALAEEPSEIRIEMCTLGYKACVNDMITLTHLTNEQLPNAGFLRRMRLRRARNKATDALAEARNSLPPGALRATRQEQQ
ncbi:MAG: hypothetical protein M3341_05090 [Actinomycetota bacterium]|nr:hypothetical protein [Actinomycetota bacterium]